MAKLLLHNVARSDPEDFEKVAHNRPQRGAGRKADRAPRAFAEGAAKPPSAGRTRTADAIKKIELTAIDGFARPARSAARRSLLAIAESKAMYATVQDQIADASTSIGRTAARPTRRLRAWRRSTFGVSLAQVRDYLAKSHARRGSPADRRRRRQSSSKRSSSRLPPTKRRAAPTPICLPRRRPTTSSSARPSARSSDRQKTSESPLQRTIPALLQDDGRLQGQE